MSKEDKWIDNILISLNVKYKLHLQHIDICF